MISPLTPDEIAEGRRLLTDQTMRDIEGLDWLDANADALLASAELVPKLREALRAYTIRTAGYYENGDWSNRICACGTWWPANTPERHAPGCLCA